MAEIETKDPVHTTVCVLTDKEEIGSDGVTGMQSMYVFHFMQLLCRAAGQDDILAFQNSVCLSADVTAAYDPSWANAFEPQNGTLRRPRRGLLQVHRQPRQELCQRCFR